MMAATDGGRHSLRAIEIATCVDIARVICAALSISGSTIRGRPKMSAWAAATIDGEEGS